MFIFLTLSLILLPNSLSGSSKPVTSVGTNRFYPLLRRSSVIVDKTLFIKAFLETDGRVILVTYPKRWGKSVNMDMVKSFVEIELSENGTALPKHNMTSTKWFFGHWKFKIAEKGLRIKMVDNGKLVHAEARDLHGEFPVISLNLHKSTNYPHTISTTIGWFRKFVSKIFNDHFYLYEGLNNILKSEDVDVDSKQWLETKENLNRLRLYLSCAENDQVTQPELAESLSFLSLLLHNHWKKKVFIFVDECDHFIEQAFTAWDFNGDLSTDSNFHEILQFLQLFFENTFQRNEYLAKALITSNLRVEEGGLFSKVKDIREFNCLTGGFAEYYGFTKPEVTQFLEQHKKLDRENEVVKWYDGYNIQGTTVYNPWSIVHYVDDLRYGGWPLSCSPEFLFKFISHPSVLYAFSALITGEPINVQLPKIRLEDVILLRKFARTKPDTHSMTEDVTKAVLNLAIVTGYLTPKSGEVVTDRERPFSVRIPTREIRAALKNNLRDHFPKDYSSQVLVTKSDNLLVNSLTQVFGSPQNTTVQEYFANAFQEFLSMVDNVELVEQLSPRAVIAAFSALRVPEVKIVGAEFAFVQEHVDLVIIVKETVGVIFEFTADRTAKQAHDQLKSRNYSMLQFDEDKYKQIKEVLRIGINIDKSTKHVTTVSDIVGNSVA